MKRMTSAIALAVAFSACQQETTETNALAAHGPVLLQAPIVAPQPPAARTILLGLLLDTSNSMDGLISQAKSQLWNIVNKLSEARCDGQRPTVRVALYEYGNDALSARGNYIRQVSPFTVNMDEISKQLFALTTNGGEEYCGAVLASSLEELDWGSNDSDLRVIYIAGNEPFTQGPISFASSCERARQKGITVNTIFCGEHREGVNTSWQAGALAAKGDYFSINHDAITMQVASPYDDELAQLNVKVNGTVIHYGAVGAYNGENLSKQDKNAEGLGWSSFNSRLKYKNENGYLNRSWDLTELEGRALDSVLVGMDQKTLPQKYQGLSEGALKLEVTRQREVKEADRNRIAELMRLREAYVAESNRKSGVTNELENAVLGSIERMASAKGFKFEPVKGEVETKPVEKMKAIEPEKKEG